MQILKPRAAFLLDFEVLQHVNEIKKKNNWTFTPEEEAKAGKFKRSGHGGVGLEEIIRDVSLYLSKNASGQIPSQEAFTELMKHLNTLELMTQEKLQIVNSLPRSMVHLYGLVEECDSRFSSEQCEGIILKINELMGAEEPEDAEENGS